MGKWAEPRPWTWADLSVSPTTSTSRPRPSASSHLSEPLFLYLQNGGSKMVLKGLLGGLSEPCCLGPSCAPGLRLELKLAFPQGAHSSELL